MATAKKKTAKASKAVSKATTSKAPAKKAPALSSDAAAKAAMLSKPKKDGKAYTKTQLIAHLAAVVGKETGTEVSKKQASAFLDAYASLLMDYAPLGALVPGVGKVVLRKTPARPKRKGRNPATGAEITIPAKKAGQKLVFRFAKQAKDLHNK